ncbi:MAG: flagellar M-ring protein FliF [Limnochordia bacterium]|nr:flagellar M-ring protein FliF [Limnochordia bacterium]
MNNMLESIKETWGKLSRPVQMAVGVFVLGVFLSLVLLGLLSRTEYQVLFSGLGTEDAGAVVSALQERGTSYQLTDGGTTVLVPEADVFEARIALATSGIPTGGVVGFEIFNTTRLGETEADRQLRYQWALQGELTRTIRQINEVADARVHIVLPKRSLFVQESESATASVLLQLNPGAQLTSGQVRAVANLVASSVEGLTPEKVTIVDSGGTVLNSASMMDLGSQVSDRFEMQWLFEQQLENSIIAMLERIYGFGNVVARVNAVMDFAQLEQYNETFTPINRGEGLVRSSQSFEESYRGTSTGAGGVPGVDSNVPGYVFLEEGGGTTEWERSEGTTNYELNRTETWTTTLPGEITNLAVSVWINGDLTPLQLASVEESVSRATGVRLERGDSVYVASVPFEVSPFMDELPSAAVATGVPIYWVIALGVLLLLTVLFLVFRKKPAQISEVPVAATLDMIVDDEMPERELTSEEKERLTMRRQIEKLAEEKPEEVASLMRGWLIDD